jgi:hypothetical protein
MAFYCGWRNLLLSCIIGSRHPRSLLEPLTSPVQPASICLGLRSALSNGHILSSRSSPFIFCFPWSALPRSLAAPPTSSPRYNFCALQPSLSWFLDLICPYSWSETALSLFAVRLSAPSLPVCTPWSHRSRRQRYRRLIHGVDTTSSALVTSFFRCY